VKRSAISLIACLSAAGWGCDGTGALADPAAQVYSRATNQFAAAIFLKPAQATNTDLACQLAPLIIQEVPATQVSAASLREPFSIPAFARDVPVSSFVIRQSLLSGTPGASNNVPAAEVARPMVCYAADSLRLAGRAHARFSYQWLYSPGGPSGRGAPLPRQGIRTTLDARGQPAVWEVLADTTGLRLIFVSQRLEAAATAEFGKPLPGRRYAIERGLDQAPAVVVPRVIDDGPLPMGPIVYLGKGTRNASTLICRCMAAQVKQLIATRTFDLTPFDGAAVSAFLSTPRTVSNAPVAVWPPDDRVENRLDHCLRLPAGF
jgi:hypothetical protein